MSELHRDLNETFEHIRFTRMSKEERLEYIKTYIVEFEDNYYEYDEEEQHVIKSIVGGK